MLYLDICSLLPSIYIAYYTSLNTLLVKQLYSLLTLGLCLGLSSALHAQCIDNTCGDITASFGFADSSDVVFCEGATVELINQVSNPNIDFYVFNWGDGAITGDDGRDTFFTTQNVSHVYQIPQGVACNQVQQAFFITMEVYLNCAAGSSCHSITAPILVLKKPDAGFEPPALLCTDQPAQFTNESCAADSVSWDYGDGSGPTTSDTHTYTAPGNYTVTITAFNECDIATYTEIVTVLESPEAQASFTTTPDPACAPTTIFFQNDGSINSQFVWLIELNGTQVWSDTTFNVNQVPESFTFTGNGTYDLSLIASNDCGDDIWTDQLVIYETPTVQLAEITPECQQYTYTPSVICNDPDGIITGYSWIFENGTPATSTDAFPTNIFFDTPGSHQVQVTITSLCGTESATQQLVVDQPTQVTIAPVPDQCQSDPIFELNGMPEGGVYSGSPAIVNDSFIDHSLAMPGVNTLTYTFGTVACQDSEDFDILIKDTTEITLTTTSYILCEDDAPFTITGFTPAAATWSGPGITSPTGVFDPQVAGLGTHVVFVEFTNSTGCLSRREVSIFVDALPSIALSQDSIFLCDAPGAIDLENVLGITEPSTATGDWSGPGITDAAEGLFDPSISGVGLFELEYVYTNQNGCITRDTLVANVQGLDPAITQPDDTVCVTAGTYQLTAVPTGGTWSGFNVTPQGLVTLANDMEGEYTYTYIVAPGTNCESTDQVTLDVVNLLDTDAGPDLLFCATDSVIVLPAGFPAGGTWSGTGVSGDTFYVATAGTGQFTLTYTATAPGGTGGECSFSDDLTLSVNPVPVLDVVVPDTICVGSDLVILNNTAGAGTLVWSWTFGDGNTSTDIAPSQAYAVAGTYTVDVALSLTTTDFGALGCTEMQSYTVVVQDTTPLTIPLTNLILCEEDPPYTFTGVTPATATWSGVGITDPSGVFDPVVSGTGTFVLTVEFVNDKGCISQRSVEVFVDGLPNTDLGTDTIVLCDAPGDVNLENLLSVVEAPTASGTWTGPGITNSDNGLFDPSINGLGVYELAYYYVTLNGCEGFDTLYVEVQPVDTAVTQPNDTFCVTDNTYQLTATPAGGVWSGFNVSPSGLISITDDMSGDYTYTYIVGLGTNCESVDTVTLNVINLLAVNGGADLLYCESDGDVALPDGFPSGGTWSGLGVTNNTLATTTLGGGVYELIYTVSATSGTGLCEASDTVEVYIDALPVRQVTVPDTVCVGEVFDILNTSPGVGTLSFTWAFGDGTGSILPAPSHSYAASGNYEIVLTVGDTACTTVDTFDIYVLDPPVNVGFVADTYQGCGPLTVQYTNQSSGVGLSYLWDFGNGTTATDEQPAAVVYEPGFFDTTYYVTLTIFNQCGTVVVTDSIEVEPLPTSVFGTEFGVYCSGDTVTFANPSLGSPDTYFWDFGDGTTSTDSLPVGKIFYTGTNDTTYTITLITTNNCGTDTATQEVLIQPTDVNAFFNTSDPTVCAGEQICFQNLSSFGARVLWDFGNGDTTSALSPCRTFDVAGTYEVTLYAFSCGSDSITQTITVNPAPVAAFDHLAFVCEGTPVDFTNTSQDLATAQWTFGNGGTSSDFSPQGIVYPVAGDYEVELVAISANGCTDTTTSTISILANPDVSVAFEDSICAGAPILITNTSTGNTLACEYTFSDGTVLTSCDPTYAFGQSGINNVSLTVTTTEGCVGSLDTFVFVSGSPVAAFDYTIVENCNPATVAFSHSSTNANQYTLDYGDGSPGSSAPDGTHIYTEGGTYTATLVASQGGICFDTATQIITIDTTPVVIATADDVTICLGDAIAFSSSMEPVDNFQWTLGDGNVRFESSFSYAYAAPGTYEVILTADYGTCTQADTLTVTVSDSITLTATPVPTACFDTADGSIDLTVSGGTAPFAYQWSNASGQEDATGLLPGDYTVTVTDAAGCSNTLTATVASPPAIEIELTNKQTVSCFGGNDGVLSIAVSGGVPSYGIAWSTNTTGNAINALTAGDYTVTVTDSEGCDLTDTFTVTQNDPITVADSLTMAGCFGETNGSIVLSDYAGGAGGYLTEVMGAGYGQPGTTHQNLGAGNYDIFIEDSLGCELGFSVELTQHAETSLSIAADTLVIDLGGEVAINTVFVAPDPVFTWSPAEDLTCSDCPEPTAAPQRPRLYVLDMIDGNGCAQSDSVYIHVELDREVEFPNAFTPNGDTNNDRFYPRSLFNDAIAQINDFRIYDRWGGLVYRATDFMPNDPNFGWDGFASGKPATAGTYTYVLEVEYVDGLIDSQSGSVLLIR